MKKVFLLIILCVAGSALVSCDTNSTANGTQEEPDKPSAENKTAEKPNDDGYLPPPELIANAEFELIDGESFSLKDSKGKVVLLNLWATWCGPCRAEMPELVALQEKYRDQGFIVVGLDTDPEPEDDIKKFAEQMKLNYKLGWAEREHVGAFFKLGQMNGIPQSFLINREGKLTGIFQGGSPKVIEQMKENVEKIVNQS